jgi:hypothetical protein
VNFKQFKYFKTDFQGIIIIVGPSSFIWFKNKTGSILGTFAEIPLMWGSQTTFQERNFANVIWDATNNMEDVDHLFDSSGWENDVPHKILKGRQW